MTKAMKYPRTFHLPWSEAITSDDKMMKSVSVFDGKRVIVTEKMDGENTSIYRDKIHARSIDGKHHASRDWVKGYWAGIRHNIPDGYRICGENLYAKHSIFYDSLPTYFLGFSMWIDDICLSWDTTMEWFDHIGITPVPVLYDGVFDETLIKGLWKKMDSEKSEGYVVRYADSFRIEEFAERVGKFVRKNHVQTDDHWMKKAIIPNGIEKSY